MSHQAFQKLSDGPERTKKNLGKNHGKIDELQNESLTRELAIHASNELADQLRV
jgi:hypothetical protein